MKYWVQYLQTPTQDALGTDGVYILDGRNNSETMRKDALKQAWRLQNVKKFWGFRLCCGPKLFEETANSITHKLEYPIHV